MDLEPTLKTLSIKALRSVLVLLVFLLQQVPSHAVVWTEKFAQEAQLEFNKAKTNFLAHSEDPIIAWQFGRAAFDQGEFVLTDLQREEVALQGIAACRKAIELAPNNAAAHYYLAMNLGQLARTKTLGALKLVKEMEKHFKRSAELDKNFDYAGATRSLGILYLEAPGWPTSIGNKNKAREYLTQAFTLASNYPENHLSLLDAFHKWGEKDALREGLLAYRKLMAKAREEFNGPEWEDSWADWNERYKLLLGKSVTMTE
ncbi:MAG: hypothetical protein ACO1QB_06700 [Verrucomicrobiales bacterium]